MKQFLVCWPDFFDVTYDINHWMHNQEGKVDKEKAQHQWKNLISSLRLVSQIEYLDGVEGLPDLVFTANAGIVQGNLVVVSKFSTTERQPEEAVFLEHFSKRGCVVRQTNLKYEGEGDHLRDNEGRHWMGSGFRTEKGAAWELEKILGHRINILELVDPRWYHLDTAFCPLPFGGVMWYPGAFSEFSQNLIRTSFIQSIEVDLDDALKFCCNCVCVDDHLFMPQGAKIVDKLYDLGYNVWQGDLSEFLKAGGAAKCLVLDLNYKK